MNIIIKNLTQNIDREISLPMKKGKIEKILGKDEWLIVDSPFVHDEFINILELNELLEEIDEMKIFILAQAFNFKEIKEMIEKENYIIINFDEETASYNNGNGVIFEDWWKGYLLHDLGYMHFPFEYKEEMEDYVCFDKLWVEANCSGWFELYYNGQHYLIYKEV